MGYAQRNVEVMKISDGKVYQAFTAIEVRCDPCALPNRRFEITYPSGHSETLAYWQLIVLDWDSARDRYIKWAMNCEVTRINKAASESGYAAMQANKFGNVPGLKLVGRGGR